MKSVNPLICAVLAVLAMVTSGSVWAYGVTPLLDQSTWDSSSFGLFALGVLALRFIRRRRSAGRQASIECAAARRERRKVARTELASAGVEG